MCSVYIERDVSVWLCPVRMIGPYILRHHMIALGWRSRFLGRRVSRCAYVSGRGLLAGLLLLLDPPGAPGDRIGISRPGIISGRALLLRAVPTSHYSNARIVIIPRACNIAMPGRHATCPPFHKYA